MPRKIDIVRKDIVIPQDKSVDDYGNLVFHNKEGTEFKIKNTGDRVERLEGQIVVGQAVELGYGNYMKHDFIAEARLVSENLPEPTKSYKPDEEGAAKMRAETKAEPQKYSPQETGMFFKEVGEMIRAGKLPSKNPDGSPNVKNHALQMVYYNRMCEVLGVKE